MPDSRENLHENDVEFFETSQQTAPAPPSIPKARMPQSKYSAEEARVAALQQELENVRKINRTVESVIESLRKAESNMNVSGSFTHSLPVVFFTLHALWKR